MRVLVVAANQEHLPDPVAPLGAALIAGAARAAGHDVALYDACFAADRAPDEITRAVRAFRPDVIGMSIRNVDDVAWPRARSFADGIAALARVARMAAPEAALVLGGAGLSLFPGRFVELTGADHAVAGEGEGAFVRLLAQLQSGRAPGPIVRGGLGSAPIRDDGLDLLDLPRYQRAGGSIGIQTKRGCALTCAYCTYPSLEGLAWRTRDPEHVADDVARLRRDRGVEHFFVVDNVFNLPLPHAHGVCEALRRAAPGVRWTAFVSPLGADRELLASMRAAGCTGVELGTDAAHPDTVRGLGKPFDVAAVIAASEACHAARVPFCHALMLGGPDERPDTLSETLRVIESTRPRAVIAMLGVRVYPGTPLAHRALAEGFIGSLDDIGLDPLFYIAEPVRDVLLDFARGVAATHPHWVFPALVDDDLQQTVTRLRTRGVRGPLWTLLGRR